MLYLIGLLIIGGIIWLYIALCWLQYKTCKALNGVAAGMSFVPILDYFAFLLAGDDGSGKISIGKLKINRVAYPFLLLIVSSVIGVLLSRVGTILLGVGIGYGYADTYKKMFKNNSVGQLLLGFLSVLFPIIIYIQCGIYIHRIKKRDQECSMA